METIFSQGSTIKLDHVVPNILKPEEWTGQFHQRRRSLTISFMYPPILLAWTWLLLSTTHASPIPTLPIPVNNPSRLNNLVHSSTSTEFNADSSNLFKRTDEEKNTKGGTTRSGRSYKKTGNVQSGSKKTPPKVRQPASNTQQTSPLIPNYSPKLQSHLKPNRGILSIHCSIGPSTTRTLDRVKHHRERDSKFPNPL